MLALLIAMQLQGGDVSLVDRVLARAFLDAGQIGMARVLVANVAGEAKADAAESATAYLERGEIALEGRNGVEALAAFRRARALAPERAAPLWGLSRASDLVGDKAGARHYAGLVVRSQAGDRDEIMEQLASWRLEQPD